MVLEKYKAKRNFSKTPEPSGSGETVRSAARKKSNLFFCVQKHLASHLHYDFRLELNGVLLSWAVPIGASVDASVMRLARAVEGHAIRWVDFEGGVRGGGGGGMVIRVERRLLTTG